MWDALGWVGSAAFALCAVPQAAQAIRDGHSKGINHGTLGLWLLGELSTLVYVWPSRQWPLISNYIFNLVFLSVVVYYYFYPRSRQ